MPSTLPCFDVREIPFSRRGSWLNLSPVIGLHQTAHDIHLISHITGMHAIVSLVPSRGGLPLETTVSADPSRLTWSTTDEVVATAVFQDRQAVRVSGSNADLTISDAATELTPFTGSYFFQDPIDRSHIFTSYESGRRYRVSALRGALVADGSESLGSHARTVTVSGKDGWEVIIEEIHAAAEGAPTTDTFDALVRDAATEFEAYLDSLADWRTDDVPAVALAVYVLWSATVASGGFLQRESVLMSKHWMDKVWSWDHTFNALALAPGLADLALDQFLTPFDHQDPSGAMPDSIAHSEVLYNFVKPPIHGWALRKLRERLPRSLTFAEVQNVYHHLARWTRFWLEARTIPGRNLPYYQHGNDSGWDNAATFDHDRVIESPDLAAFLVIQLDVLVDLAAELDQDGVEWRLERDRLQTALLTELHDQDGFYAVGVRTRRISKRTSLLTLLPILAADYLPRSVSQQLARDIEGHLTEWGAATQLVGSVEYESDGYWRGPIWAPSTMLIEEGLRRSGDTDLADLVNERFRALCEQSGFAENFDAVTGEGLRDRAYTWTASVYLVFAHEWLLRQQPPN